MTEEKITLDIKHNRSNGSFECTMSVATEYFDVEENKTVLEVTSTQKIGGTNGAALLKKLVMLLNANLEDMADEG